MSQSPRGDTLSSPEVRTFLTAIGAGDAAAGLRDVVLYDSWWGADEEEGGVATSGVLRPQRWSLGNADLTPYPERGEPALDAEMTALLEQRGDEELVNVTLLGWRADRTPIEDRWTATSRARLAGADVEAAENAWRQAFLTRGAPLVASLLAILPDSAEVLGVDESVGAVFARMPAGEVRPLLEHEQIRLIGTDELRSEEGILLSAGYGYGVGGYTLDGRELANLLQTTQFYDVGFEGAGEHLGMIEPTGDHVWDKHPAFEDANQVPRFTNWIRQNNGTWTTLSWGAGTKHPTWTAGVLIADISHGQCCFPGWTNGDRQDRSGVARESTADGIHVYGDQQFAEAASFFVNPPSGSTEPIVINMSIGWGEGQDPSLQVCKGTHTWSQYANDLYEAGRLVVAGAGNEGYWGSCNVRAPADAIGSLAVGAYTPSVTHVDTATA